MTTDELAKRIDGKIAQLHKRWADLDRKTDELHDSLTDLISEWHNLQLEKIHDYKKTLDDQHSRIESLEKHPPDSPVDDKLSELHARIDEHSNLQERQRAEYLESILAFRDTILEEIHDLKNVLEGHRFRIQSLEKHPPDFKVPPISTQPGPGGPPG